MTSSIPPDNIVTIIRSPMPAIPLPIAPSHSIHVNEPSAKPMTALMTMPIAKTAITLIPDIASPITAIYGNNLIHAILPEISVGDIS